MFYKSAQGIKEIFVTVMYEHKGLGFMRCCKFINTNYRNMKILKEKFENEPNIMAELKKSGCSKKERREILEMYRNNKLKESGDYFVLPSHERCDSSMEKVSIKGSEERPAREAPQSNGGISLDLSFGSFKLKFGPLTKNQGWSIIGLGSLLGGSFLYWRYGRKD